MDTKAKPRPKLKQFQVKGGTKTHVTLDGLASARLEYCRAAVTHLCGGIAPSSSLLYRLALEALVGWVEEAALNAMLAPIKEQREWRRRLRAAAECNEAPPLPIPDPDEIDARWPRFEELYPREGDDPLERVRREMVKPFYPERPR